MSENESKLTIFNEIEMLGDEWSSADNDINDYKNEIKNLNNKKKELTDRIIQKMKTNNLKCAPVTDGILELVSKPVPQSLNKEHIKTCINKCINNINKADEITDFIFTNKEVVKKDDLKKIKRRTN